jgi:hypothetical protein
VFQPPDSETFPLRPTPRYCQSPTQLPSSNHCIHKGSTKLLTRIGSLFIRTSHEKKKILQVVPSPSSVTSCPRSASLRLLSRDSRARLAAYHPKPRPLFNSASSSPLLSTVLLQLLSSSLPPKKKARQDTKQQHRHQALPLAASLQPTPSRNSRLAPKRLARLCRIVYLAASQLRALYPSFLQCLQDIGSGANTQSSDLHTIQFCHLTACRDLALPDKVRSPP